MKHRALAVVVAAVTFTQVAHAQIEMEMEETRTPVRVGLWSNVGAGTGSLGCSLCQGERVNGFSGTFTVGGSLSETFLVGGGGAIWTKTVNDTSLTVGLIDARFRFYLTTPRSNLFLTFGAGLGRIGAAVATDTSASEIGTGFVFGVGYDLHLTRNISITPYAHWFGVKTENLDVNIPQAGISITVH